MVLDAARGHGPRAGVPEQGRVVGVSEVLGVLGVSEVVGVPLVLLVLWSVAVNAGTRVWIAQADGRAVVRGVMRAHGAPLRVQERGCGRVPGSG